MICSGPHIAVGNPVFKTPRAICEEKGDYDVVDLTAIPDNYMARTNYTIDVDLEEYIRRDAEIWGVKYHTLPRLVSRKMLNLKQERTFNVAIIPEGYGHINGLVGVAFSNYRDLLIAGSSWASIPLDFYVKVMGKANFNYAAASGFPVLNSKYDTAIITRGILLNAVTKNYTLVYEKSLEYMEKCISWAKEDIRLPKKELPDKWERNVALRTDYERRQALVEIDVLTAMNRHQQEAKKYLSQAFGLNQRIESKLGQIEDLHDLATKATVTYSDMPKSPNRDGSRMEDAIIKIIDLENEINQDMMRLVELKKDIIRRIKAVESAELQTILELRYLSYMRWEEIAIELGYGIDNVFRLHRNALDEIMIPETIQ